MKKTIFFLKKKPNLLDFQCELISKKKKNRLKIEIYRKIY